MSRFANKSLQAPPGYWLIPVAPLRRIVTTLTVAALAIGLLVYFTHPAWLTALGKFLVVSGPPRQADAIIVLGGGSGDREMTGARLYHGGFGQHLLTTGQTVDVIGVEGTFAELSAHELERAGVPPERIARLSDSGSTCDDARLSREWLRQRGAASLIVVSDPFHMRRAMLLFEREYAGTGIELVPVAASPSWFDTRLWWRREKDSRVVVEEYIKLAYYLAAGCPG
jgi:uncharacterized SAM-binding protein YcdF (DUF218 family)